MPDRTTPRTPDDKTFAAARLRALEEAADLARLAPSVHNTQPWALVVQKDRLQLRVDRARLVPAIDPLGRAVVISIGAALFNVRVTLAAAGWVADVARLPRTDDADLLAEVRPVMGRPDSDLAALSQVIRRRHTNRRPFTAEPLPDDILVHLTELAALEETQLVPVLRPHHRALVIRLTQEAARRQTADPGYRAELRRWTTRDRRDRDGVPPSAVPHAEGIEQENGLIRNFDTQGTGELPVQDGREATPALIVLATVSDDRAAWLHTGEALERILLELTSLDWKASPITQPLEVPATRAGLREALTHAAHPQMLLRIGRAAPTAGTPRRARTDVGRTSSRRPHPSPTRSQPERREENLVPPQAVSDGRGGTVWTRRPVPGNSREEDRHASR